VAEAANWGCLSPLALAVASSWGNGHNISANLILISYIDLVFNKGSIYNNKICTEVIVSNRKFCTLTPTISHRQHPFPFSSAKPVTSHNINFTTQY